MYKATELALKRNVGILEMVVSSESLKIREKTAQVIKVRRITINILESKSAFEKLTE